MEHFARCLRFPDGLDANLGFSLKGSDNFNLCVNKNVFLCGFGLLGRQRGTGTGTFTITLKNDAGTVLGSISENITSDGTSQFYEEFFETPILLEQSKMYNIEDLRNGPKGVFTGLYRDDGKVTMEEKGVIFQISRASPAEDIHALTRGRIASFIFKC